MSAPATILIVDDLAANRVTLCGLLETEGYRLVEAADGAGALRLAAETLPDLVLLDVNMPDMDGFEVCRRLRADGRLAEIPVIMVTGLDDQASRLKGIEAGADDFIKKPFDCAEMSARVRTVTRLNRYRRLQEARERVREIEARFGQLAELSDEVFRFAALNPERTVYISPAVETIWGRPAASFLEDPRQWEQGIHPDDAPRVHAAYEAVLAGRADRFLEEYRVVRPDGSVRWVLDSSTPIREGGAAIVSIGGVARDITARKQAEQERHELLSQLEHAKRLESIGQLAAGIAHEINTPMQFITDNTHFLTKGCGQVIRLLEEFRSLREAAELQPLLTGQSRALAATEQAIDLAYLLTEIPQALKQNLDGLGQVARIVHSLKELTHPRNARRAATDLNHVIATAITVSRHEWKYVAEVVTDFSPELPPVPCVVDEINQVILNLLVNAAHAIESAHKERPAAAGKGTITVRTRPDGAWALVEVADTGTGIPDEILPRIFEPFFTTKEIGKGTGQGLALVHAVMVKRHQGTVNVTTQTGRGTTFHLRLPLSVPPHPTIP